MSSNIKKQSVNVNTASSVSAHKKPAAPLEAPPRYHPPPQPIKQPPHQPVYPTTTNTSVSGQIIPQQHSSSQDVAKHGVAVVGDSGHRFQTVAEIDRYVVFVYFVLFYLN